MLPPYIERRFEYESFGTRREYFVNHKTKTTSWHYCDDYSVDLILNILKK